MGGKLRRMNGDINMIANSNVFMPRITLVPCSQTREVCGTIGAPTSIPEAISAAGCPILRCLLGCRSWVENYVSTSISAKTYNATDRVEVQPDWVIHLSVPCFTVELRRSHYEESGKGGNHHHPLFQISPDVIMELLMTSTPNLRPQILKTLFVELRLNRAPPVGKST